MRKYILLYTESILPYKAIDTTVCCSRDFANFVFLSFVNLN
nr:MAG TPA: hypothetical protein [Herelleviridae sp.]